MASRVTKVSFNGRWAAIVSTALMLAVAIALATVHFLPGPLVDRVLETDTKRHALLWQKSVLMHLEDSEAVFNGVPLTEHDAEYLGLLTATSDVFRYKLIDGSGTILWSTHPEEIGTQDTTQKFSTALATGETGYYQHAMTEDLVVERSQGRPGSPDNILQIAEIYTPVLSNGNWIGAISFCTDLTAQRHTFVARVRLWLGTLSTIILAALFTVAIVINRSNRHRNEQIEQRNAQEREITDRQLKLAREVRLLSELNEWLQSSRSLDELFEMVSAFMTHILPAAEGSIYVFSNSRDVLDGCASWNGGEHHPHIHPEECWGLRRGRAYEFGTSEVAFVCAHAEPHDDRPYFCFPILAHGETVGLMHLQARCGEIEAFFKSKKLARMCAEQISMAISNVRMRDQLHDQSVRDPLTGLFNRRHMNETLRKCINAGNAVGASLSVIALDVDHFKKFNDNHGHDAGDMVLRAVGEVLGQACDRDITACRMGGEEFAMIVPGLVRPEVEAMAEDLRLAVEAITIRYGEKTLPHITISAGVAHFPEHGALPQDLMRAADDALYDAKAKGRNQVCIALPPVDTTVSAQGAKAGNNKRDDSAAA